MKRLVIVHLFIAILLFNGRAFAVPFEILSQSYHVDGYTQNYTLGITNSFDITQSTPTGFTNITMPGTTMTNWLTFTDGGYLGSESLFIEASGNANAFAWYTRNENLEFQAYTDAHATSTIVFRPTSAFFVDFSFYVQSWDATVYSELLIDGVKTYWSYSSAQTGMACHETADPSDYFCGGNPYDVRLFLDPSKTYTIIADMDNSYASGGVHGHGTAALTATVVPEPSSIVFLALGLVSLGLASKRKRPLSKH
jgi:hypothetical protein